jgi:glycosyltransferase involved in cell wall biosynthesis
MGRVLVEAMALGIPVVATRVGGIPAVVGDEEAGRLVPPEDVAALTDALDELARDAPLRAKLGRAARERAERFSVRVAEARLGALYAELARR